MFEGVEPLSCCSMRDVLSRIRISFYLFERRWKFSFSRVLRFFVAYMYWLLVRRMPPSLLVVEWFWDMICGASV